MLLRAITERSLSKKTLLFPHQLKENFEALFKQTRNFTGIKVSWQNSKINYQVCQKSAPYFNAITNTKNCLYWYKLKDYTVAIEVLRCVSTLLKGLIRQKKKTKNYESLQKVR